MEQKDNSGALFANEKKSQDNHPDYTGKCMVNGKEHDIAAWVKTAKTGKRYLSLQFKQPYKANTSRQTHDLMQGDGDLPF